jgi:hypothetical protein
MQQTLGSTMKALTQKRFPTIRFEDMNTEADAIMGNDIYHQRCCQKLTGNKLKLWL